MKNRVVLLIPLFLLAFPAVQAGQEARRYHALNEDLNISKTELPNLELSAMKGSGEAAYRLAQYSYFVALDGDEGLRWLTIAAENGDAAGEYGLALRLSERKGAGNNARACFWLNKAKAHATAEVELLANKLLVSIGRACTE